MSDLQTSGKINTKPNKLTFCANCAKGVKLSLFNVGDHGEDNSDGLVEIFKM